MAASWQLCFSCYLSVCFSHSLSLTLTLLHSCEWMDVDACLFCLSVLCLSTSPSPCLSVSSPCLSLFVPLSVHLSFTLSVSHSHTHVSWGVLMHVSLLSICPLSLLLPVLHCDTDVSRRVLMPVSLLSSVFLSLCLPFHLSVCLHVSFSVWHSCEWMGVSACSCSVNLLHLFHFFMEVANLFFRRQIA